MLKQSIIRRQALKAAHPELDAIVRQIAVELISEYIPQITDELVENAEKFAKEIISEKVSKKLKGDKGEQGIRGFPGLDGETPSESELIGIIKPLIPAPIKGDRGEPGKQGAPGIGIKGEQGRPGKDGSPDKPNEVVAKINAASAKIRMTAIAGLREALQRAVREGRGGGGKGGGGMGNVQHESKSVSSATTQITTNYPIAGGGYAIWGFYQGGNIVRGTDYTVSSDRKTIPLLFTPQDSTNIDLIYIRG